MKQNDKYYVGHRGSRGVGVENTIEAFLEGIRRSYQALECDVRVSKDLQFIIFHDPDLKRLALRDEIVENMTLEELKSIVLTQKIGERVLSGKIPTLQEYLELCKKYQVTPLIELKWSTGINNNDCTNVDKLIKLIEEHDALDQAIILTSMTNVLQYLRNYYPNLQLQLLLGASQPLNNTNLKFAFYNNISLDLHYSLVTQEIINLAHQNNVLVNCWSVNDEGLAQKFAKMGIDMITTDDLR